MNERALREKFPNASAAFLRANSSDRPPSCAKPEPAVRNEPVAKTARKNDHAKPVRVCVTGFRRRLLDPDNFCPKYFIDCLRYAELIPDDRAEDIVLEVRQIKVKRREDERTEIVIEPL